MCEMFFLKPWLLLSDNVPPSLYMGIKEGTLFFLPFYSKGINL